MCINIVSSKFNGPSVVDRRGELQWMRLALPASPVDIHHVPYENRKVCSSDSSPRHTYPPDNNQVSFHSGE